jgi:hypothetical protein
MRLKYILLLFIAIPFLGNAQKAFINKGSTIYIQSQALLEVITTLHQPTA